MSMSEAFLLANGLGFGISFVFNIIYNAIQKKDSREKIDFGSVMGWGLFLSIVFLIFFFLRGCESYATSFV